MGCRYAKKILLLVIFVLLAIIILPNAIRFEREDLDSSILDKISYSFYFSEPKLNEIKLNNNSYTKIDMAGCLEAGKQIGDPVLPVNYKKILIPPGRELDSIKITGKAEDIDLDNINLIKKPIVPYQTPVTFNSKKPVKFSINNSTYKSKKVFPLYIEENHEIQNCRGYKILSIAINPVQYIPAIGELRYYPKIKIDINFKKNFSYNQFYRNNENDKTWVKKLIDNPDIFNDIDKINDFNSQPTFSYTGGLCDEAENYDYVIITTTENGLNHWETSVSKPYNWTSLMNKHYTDNNLNCNLVTIQDINLCSDYWSANSLFNDTPAHIREFCKDAYQDWGTEYIFIGGDDELIPAREMAYGIGTNPYSEVDVDSDIYWNHLDNTFNDDQDSYWGEKGDSGFDFYAEMYIGRITCDTPQDVSNWMKKSFYYADSTCNDYIENAAFFGGDSGWDCEGDDFVDYSAIKGTEEWLGPVPNNNGPYPDWIGFQFGFETWNNNYPNNMYNLSEKWTQEPPNSGWQGGSSSAGINGLKNAINNDQVTLLSAIAHADATISCDVTKSSWEANYHNTKPFFIHDYGCHCGDMDAADDGVLHSMLFHSDTELAFGCVYNTCFGWGNDQSTNSSSSFQQKCFWDYFFDLDNNSISINNWQLGKAMAFSRDTMASTLNWDTFGMWRAIIQGCLLFADPAQKLKCPLSPPSQNNEYPQNLSNNIDLSPLCEITTIDNDSSQLDIFFFENSTGNWVEQYNTSSSPNSVVTWTYSNANTYNTSYFWSVNITDGLYWSNSTYKFTTRMINIPDKPSNFNATKINHSCILLNWINSADNKTYIEYNTSSANWLIGQGIVVCNITGNSYHHKQLIPNTKYYYQAWTWNQTDRTWSINKSNDNATTDQNSEPYLVGEYPFNSSNNQTIQPICNITIYDEDLDNINVYFYENTTGGWTLKQSNISCESGSNIIWNKYLNANRFNNRYWWSVHITDGYDWTNQTFYFETENLTTVYINDDYNESTDNWHINKYNHIQQGIDNISEDGNVYVYNGIYQENIIIDKNLTLTSFSYDKPILDGQRNTGITISDNFVIINNFIINNCSNGIKIFNSTKTISNIQIINNTIKNNTLEAIYIQNSQNNNITGNIINNNSGNGLLLISSSNNKIYKNNFINNSKNGTSITSSSDNNIIYYNNFLNNSYSNAYDSCDNYWFNSSLGGNYWDDYNGLDENLDGIGDDEYDNITGGINNDTYPLIKKYEKYFILLIEATSSVNENEQFIVTIKTEGGSIIQRARVEFNGIIYNLNNSNGQITIDSPDVTTNTDYIIYVTKTGYSPDSKSISVLNSGNPSSDDDSDDDYTPIPPPNPTNENDDSAPQISNIYHTPEEITKNSIINIYAKVEDDKKINNVKLYWKKQIIKNKNMIKQDNNVYYARIGPYEENTSIIYWIEATDNNSQTTKSINTSFNIIDKTGPNINIKLPKENATIYDKTPDIKITYNDINGIKTDSLLLKINNENFIPQMITSTYMILKSEKEFDYGKYQLEISISDNLGNYGNKSFNYFIAECESISEKNIINVKKEDRITFIPDNFEKSQINNLTLITLKNFSNLNMIITKLYDKPDEIKIDIEDKKVYSYISLELINNYSYLEDNELKELMINFKVTKNWIENNKIDKNQIHLLRFVNNTWIELPTSIINEGNTYLLYQAITTGTSTFAIVGDEIIQNNNNKIENKTSIPWLLIIGILIICIIIIIVMLFKTGFLYFE